MRHSRDGQTSTRTVEQTRVERNASSDECNQETSASKSTLSSRNATTSTGDTSLLELVCESLPGLLRVHVGADALVPAKGSGWPFGNCRSIIGLPRTEAPSSKFSFYALQIDGERNVEQCGEPWCLSRQFLTPPADYCTVRLGLLGLLVSAAEPNGVSSLLD